MKKNETKLLASRAVNKIGNVMYDYGNSTWIAGLGSIGQKYMGYYQLAENVISLFLNPIGGAVADRFKRRQILLVTDFIGGLMCAVLAFIGNDNIMLYRCECGTCDHERIFRNIVSFLRGDGRSGGPAGSF